MVRDLLQFNTLCKRLFIGMIAVLFVFCGAYGFLLKQTVASVVGRRALELEKRDLAARIGTLETSYIQATDEITLARARERGFVLANAERFVSHAPQTLSFQYDADE